MHNVATWFSPKVKLITNLMKREMESEYPETMKWSIQMLFMHDGKWRQICRIDNYPHENQNVPHIHKGGRVIPVDIRFDQAEEAVRNAGEAILRERYKVNIRGESL
jgi:hypothetical protein